MLTLFCQTIGNWTSIIFLKKATSSAVAGQAVQMLPDCATREVTTYPLDLVRNFLCCAPGFIKVLCDYEIAFMGTASFSCLPTILLFCYGMH